ncbi:MAG: FHA domain-containing protein [Deltaproteobacteria bacterium]|nr:FHA domain-containing protein [Deltaproteobacteria bacterium]
MPSIHIIAKDGRIYDYTISKNETIIGRGKDCDIVLKDTTISRNHAKIKKLKRDYSIVDLGSFNGTLVNGKSIQNVTLHHNDEIKIGLTRLIYKDQADRFESSDVLIFETDDGPEDLKIIKSNPLADYRQSEELLVEGFRGKDSRITLEDIKIKNITEEGVSKLERSNKVLFVLYEISRQLNSIGDFNELLNKIMDLIFMIIDADYGFLILTGEKGKEDLIPVVVKVKNEKIKEKGDIKASRTIVNKVIKDKVSLLTSNAMMDSRLEHGKSLFLQQIRSAMCVPLWKKDTIIGVIQLGSIRMDNHFDQDDLQLLQTISSQMAMIIEQASLNEQIREEEMMRNRLARFHSPQVIELILKSGQETKDNIMEPKDITATILFADIIGFTRLSEKMPPRDINMILNRFFSRMTDIIFEFDGTLDKYIGDALMAVFGAPMEKTGDEERAIRAALKMRDELAVMMENTAVENRFDVRIGINTGRVVAGNIGSPRRMDYTVIGDPVNIAQRLESIAQPNQILIGQETYNHVKGKFKIEKIGEKRVKGKTKEIMAYEVLS